MKTFILTLSILLSLSVFAQKKEYLDEYSHKLSGRNGATYYRLMEQKGSNFLVADFYVSNDQPKMIVMATEVSPEIKYEGKYRSFYENGQVEDEGECKHGKRVGPWKSYHDNGQQAAALLHNGDTTFYQQAWDESGKAVLENGSGIFTKKSTPKGKLQHFDVLNSLLIAMYSIDEVSGDSIYLFLAKPTEYQGGLEGLSEALAEVVEYPNQARRMGVEGIVYVSFLVDK